jgi:hypothetical protein
MKDRIFDYLNDELSPTERSDFENALAKDPILQQELDFHKNKWMQLRAVHLKKIAQEKTPIWTAGAAKLRRQQRIIRLTIAVAALTAGVGAKFAYDGWKKKEKPIIQAPIRRNEANQAKIDSMERQKNVNKDQANVPVIEAKPQQPLPKNKVKKMPPPTKQTKQDVIVTTSQDKISPDVVLVSKADTRIKAGGNGMDTTQNQLTKIKITPLDSVLRIPIKALVSKADLLKRFEKVLHPKENRNIQKIINLYYETDGKILFEEADQPTQEDFAALWLLKAFYNLEITHDRSSILNCLRQMPPGFFEIEKIVYEKILELEQHKTTVLPLIQQMQQDSMNIHFEKAAKIVAIL